MRKRLLIVTAVAITASVALAYSGRADDPVDASPLTGNYTYAEAQAFPDYPLFAPGREFDSLPLTAIERRLTASVEFHDYRVDNVSFVYGDCEPEVEGPCTAPAVVQIWRACERHADEYEADAEESTYIRGVPAHWYEEGRRLELYTANVVVVTWAEGQRHVVALANSLKLINADMFPQYDLDAATLLPPPHGTQGITPVLGEPCRRDGVTPDGGPYDVEIP